MATARTNLETAQSEAEKVVEAKDSEVLLLRGEIDKMNEKLQMYAKMSNAGDPELMASAAARTAKMMNNASSLTEIYAEHFSLIAELESKKADLREAERTIVQLRDILIEHTPQIQQRQEHFDQAIRDVEILREKLGRYERDREQLLTSRDSCLSELQFTKNSLEEKQRECQTLSKQVQNLVACVQSSGSSESVEEGSELFSSIQELQQRNLELISRIKTMEVEKDEAIRNAQDAQFNELKHKMEVATQNLETSELRSKNLATCKNEAEKQRDYYKKAFDDLQKRAEDALDSPKVNQIRRDKEAAESRAQLAEQQVTDLKQELERNEQQAAAKNELWKNANDEAKAMITTLNNNVETKQAQINNLLDEKRSVTQSLRELEVRHRTQANHTNFLEKGNHKLLEKQTTMNDELQKLHTAKLELDKQLQQWKQTAQMTQLELDIIRQRANADLNLNSTLTELSTILDRKKLLMETMQSSVATKLTAERDEWRQKYESINSEKLQTEGDLKAELFRYQNECTRLEVEWNSARDLS
ncbi:M protein repeat protein [Aphelenchoides bicaudatus]|nr:M protein repeat protein [Aphelenchoides bicaudatus]